MTLKSYYSSKYWRSFRSSLLEDIDVKCEICGRPKWSIYKKTTKKHKPGDKKRLITLSVHHKTYKRLGHEKRSDVLCLCRFCHELGHSLQRASELKPDVYSHLYNSFKDTTAWDYEKRPKDDKKLIE